MGLNTTFDVIAKLPIGQGMSYLQAALAEPYPEIQLRALALLAAKAEKDKAKGKKTATPAKKKSAKKAKRVKKAQKAAI